MPNKTVKVITDRFCNIAKQYSYDSFGNVTGERGRIKNNFLYKSMFFEPYSEMYFEKGRTYSPEYRIFTGGGLKDVRFTANHITLDSTLLGLPILEMHPDKHVYPLNVLKERIDYFHEN